MSPGSPWPSSIYCNINERVWSHPLQENEEEIAEHSQQSKHVARHRATVWDEPVQSLVHWQNSFLRHSLIHLFSSLCHVPPGVESLHYIVDIFWSWQCPRLHLENGFFQTVTQRFYWRLAENNKTFRKDFGNPTNLCADDLKKTGECKWATGLIPQEKQKTKLKNVSVWHGWQTQNPTRKALKVFYLQTTTGSFHDGHAERFSEGGVKKNVSLN